MLLARKIGLILIATGAILVFFLMAPDGTKLPDGYGRTGDDIATVRDYRVLTNAAIEDYNTVFETAETSEQQQVANGWITRDLLTVLTWEGDDTVQGIASLLDASSPDHRTPAMIGLVVLAIAWWGITAPGGWRPKPARQPAPAEY